MYKTVEKLFPTCVEAVFSLWGKSDIVHRPEKSPLLIKSYSQKTECYAQFLVRIKTVFVQLVSGVIGALFTHAETGEYPSQQIVCGETASDFAQMSVSVAKILGDQLGSTMM